MKSLRVGAVTHVGRVRDENQDRMSRFLSPLGEVFLIADGMGGHNGGATAAAMATNGFEEVLRRPNPGTHSLGMVLQDACRQTNEAIHRESRSGNPETAHMGSTVVLALLSHDRALIAHVGDSRAYLFRKGRLQKLTRDHSRVQSLVDQGYLTEQEAWDHPDSNVLSRCLGVSPEVQLEVSPPVDLQRGDALVLCSDGLCGYIENDRIGETLARYPDPQNAAEALLQLALDAGGGDNTTIQVIQAGERRSTRYLRGATPQGMSGSKVAGLVAGFLVILLGMLVTGIQLGRKVGPRNSPETVEPKAPSKSAPGQPGDTKNRKGETTPEGTESGVGKGGGSSPKTDKSLPSGKSNPKKNVKTSPKKENSQSTDKSDPKSKGEANKVPPTPEPRTADPAAVKHTTAPAAATPTTAPAAATPAPASAVVKPTTAPAAATPAPASAVVKPTTAPAAATPAPAPANPGAKHKPAPIISPDPNLASRP